MTRLLDTARAFVAAMDDCKRDALDPDTGTPPFSTALRHDARDDARHFVYERLTSKGLERPFMPQDAHALSRSFADYYRDVLHTGHLPFRRGFLEPLANTTATEWCKKINSLVSVFIRKIVNGEVTVHEADDVSLNQRTSAVFSDKGTRNTQEDRHLLVHDLSLWREPHELAIGSQAATSLFAVFDGHGGSEVSAYVAAHMATAFVAAGGVATEDCLQKTFTILEGRVKARIEKEGWKSGSTSVVLALDDHTVAFSWEGDSSLLVLRAHKAEWLSSSNGGTSSFSRTKGEFLALLLSGPLARSLSLDDVSRTVCNFIRSRWSEEWADLPSAVVENGRKNGREGTCLAVYIRPPKDLWSFFQTQQSVLDVRPATIEDTIQELTVYIGRKYHPYILYGANDVRRLTTITVQVPSPDSHSDDIRLLGDPARFADALGKIYMLALTPVMGETLIHAFRGNTGFGIRRGIKHSEDIVVDKENPKVNPCRVFDWSNSGRYFAYCDTIKTCVIEATTGRTILDVQLKRTADVMFSPKDSMFLTWEPYETRNPVPNLRMWNLNTGVNIASLIAQKQSSWRPQFSEDELTCARLIGSELLIYKNNTFNQFHCKISIPKMEGFSLSPGQNLHLACYVGAYGGEPAYVRVYRLDTNQVICNRTLSKSDSAKLSWNNEGTALLILPVVDVSSTNKFYYGKQSIHIFKISDFAACQIPVGKSGPIYEAKWNPNGRQFAVCYGYMPSKVTLYNLRAEAVFDLVEGPCNEIHYNAFGSVLLVCGFGNLANGKMEFWDVVKKKLIIEIAVPNTTFLQWAPDGQHFVTATTTPRHRIGNCYRIWNYQGKMLAEIPYASPQEELWQVSFRPLPGVYNRFPVPKLTMDQKAAAGLLYRSETEKKMFNVGKKLHAVEALKKRVADGEVLEINQLEKIKKEGELLAQLEELRLS